MNCQYCGEAITTQNVPMPHFDGKKFYMHHYHHECYCFKGSDGPDPPEMTKRQAALAAFALWCEENNPK